MKVLKVGERVTTIEGLFRSDEVQLAQGGSEGFHCFIHTSPFELGHYGMKYELNMMRYKHNIINIIMTTDDMLSRVNNLPPYSA